MKKIIQQSLIIPSVFLFSCTQSKQCEQGINLLPMHGGRPKCEEQLMADKVFFLECDRSFANRHLAAKFYIEKAWEFFYKNDYEMSMKRFNQAWLLDSLNADIYWGFGNLSGSKHKYKQSIELFEKSIKLNPNNPRVYECIATSYGQLSFEMKDTLLVNKTIDNLKIALNLDPESANAFGQLTVAFFYLGQKDSARKYLALTDKLNPEAINPEVRKILMENSISKHLSSPYK